MDFESSTQPIVVTFAHPPTTSNAEIKLTFKDDTGEFAGAKFSISKGSSHRARLFADRSVMELFVDDEVCCTRVVRSGEKFEKLKIIAESSGDAVRTMHYWDLAAP